MYVMGVLDVVSFWSELVIMVNELVIVRPCIFRENSVYFLFLVKNNKGKSNIIA